LSGQTAPEALVAAAHAADLKPAPQRVARLGVQADRALLVALGAAHADHGLLVVELDVLRCERQRLVDPQPGAPQRQDQRAVAHAGRRALRAARQQSPDVGLLEDLRGPERTLIALPGHWPPFRRLSHTFRQECDHIAALGGISRRV
jgi:hypothetical protein